MKSQKSLGILGCGKLAEAMLQRFLTQKLIKPTQVILLAHRNDRDRDLAKRYGVRVAPDAETFCALSDIILLGVKPQQMADSLSTLKPFYSTQLIITIAAGWKTSSYQRALTAKARIIRVMPNLAVQTGSGVLGIFFGGKITAAEKKWCHQLLSSTGYTFEVKSESLLDAVTAVSASGLGFAAAIAKFWIITARNLGLSEDVAKASVLQTLRGLVDLLSATGESLDELLARITSKKGTTHAGLEVFRKKNIAKIFDDTLKAAIHRAKELSQ